MEKAKTDELLFLSELNGLFFTCFNIFPKNWRSQRIFRDMILDWLYISWVQSLKAGDSYISRILYTGNGCFFTTTKINRISEHSLWCGKDRYRRSDGKLIGSHRKLCFPMTDEDIDWAEAQNLKLGV